LCHPEKSQPGIKILRVGRAAVIIAESRDKIKGDFFKTGRFIDFR
jgi:hypothetical protein